MRLQSAAISQQINSAIAVNTCFQLLNGRRCRFRACDDTCGHAPHEDITAAQHEDGDTRRQEGGDAGRQEGGAGP